MTPEHIEQVALKPCPNPWCTSTTMPIPARSKYGRGQWSVGCACGLKSFSKDTEAEAITAWNTRPGGERFGNRPSSMSDAEWQEATSSADQDRREELIDLVCEALDDSMGPEWNTRLGARYVAAAIEAMPLSGWEAERERLREALRQIAVGRRVDWDAVNFTFEPLADDEAQRIARQALALPPPPIEEQPHD